MNYFHFYLLQIWNDLITSNITDFGLKNTGFNFVIVLLINSGSRSKYIKNGHSSKSPIKTNIPSKNLITEIDDLMQCCDISFLKWLNDVKIKNYLLFFFNENSLT